MIEKSRRETSGFFFVWLGAISFARRRLSLRGPTVMVNLLKFNELCRPGKRSATRQKSLSCLHHNFQQRIQQAGKTGVQILPGAAKSCSPVPEAVARSHRCRAGRASGGSWWTWPPPPGAGRCSSASLPSASVRMILQSQRVSERGKDIFQANLFSFGVIGDHNNPVSAVARRIAAAAHIGGWRLLYPNSGSDTTRRRNLPNRNDSKNSSNILVQLYQDRRS